MYDGNVKISAIAQDTDSAHCTERNTGELTTTTTTTGTPAIVIDAEGVARLVSIPDTSWDTLRRDWIGGWIEEISGSYDGEPWVAYCDEDGTLKQLPGNAMASALARELGWRFSSHGVLVGTVMFFGRDQRGEAASVPAPVIAHARAIGVLPATASA
jgi:hypothetical protein